ncbi:hypothetical protein CBS63078_11165 [Aspergillus niger]|nr:hypothetical protein CBS63078_11165 [Aspergillus niger]
MSPLGALKWVKRAVLPSTTLQREKVWETRNTFVLAPLEPHISCDIQPQEAALAKHNQLYRTDAAILYTDGSGYRGGVGASVVSIHAGQAQKAYLGTEADSAVYVAELKGVDSPFPRVEYPTELQPDLLVHSQSGCDPGGWTPGRLSGQLYMWAIYNKYRTLQSVSFNLIIHWIPAHIGVEGNEVRDSEVKRAAEYGARPGQQIIRLVFTAKRAVRSKFQEQ